MSELSCVEVKSDCIGVDILSGCIGVDIMSACIGVDILSVCIGVDVQRFSDSEGSGLSAAAPTSSSSIW